MLGGRNPEPPRHRAPAVIGAGPDLLRESPAGGPSTPRSSPSRIGAFVGVARSSAAPWPPPLAPARRPPGRLEPIPGSPPKSSLPGRRPSAKATTTDDSREGREAGDRVGSRWAWLPTIGRDREESPGAPALAPDDHDPGDRSPAPSRDRPASFPTTMPTLDLPLRHVSPGRHRLTPCAIALTDRPG